ncbi:MAG: histidine--tRNA ligase [Magnetococcales bacterium]|nr:histidine--tRNA ligase [Magnetococcales bacterium]
MAAAIKAVRGTRDILDRESPTWRFLEATAARVFSLYGYRELRTPIFEKTELFARAVGGDTDIVEKEMYVFEDRNGASLALRPEGTAGVVRSFIENGLDRQLPWRVFYKGPMFRYERPQKGRYRQFHQMGCELFGPPGPMADAEMLMMVMRFFIDAGLEELVTLELNSLGCPACRPGYREKLLEYLHAHTEALCGNCQSRLERNPLRVLDCKNPNCKEVAASAPRTVEHLCTACGDHFQGLTGHLEAENIPLTVNPMMVRGLDYYTRTVFEVTTTALGAQNAVAAGGRYDGLVATMGGRATPAIGFAMGLERLALLLDERACPDPATPTVYVVAAGEGADLVGLGLTEQLRRLGVATEINLQGGSMRNQMKKAGRSGAPWSVIIGEREVDEGTVQLKQMATGEQQTLASEGLAERIAGRLYDGS